MHFERDLSGSLVVYNQNQVSISSTETKVQYQYWSQTSFFLKLKLYFSTFWEDISFYELENKPRF